MIRLQSGVSLSPLTYMFAPCALTSCTMLIQVFLTIFLTDEHGLLFVYKELYVMYHVNSGTFDNIPNQQEWAIVSLRSLAWENLMTCSFTDYTHSSNYLMFIHKDTRINSYSFEFAPERYKSASQQEEDFIPTRWVVH